MISEITEDLDAEVKSASGESPVVVGSGIRRDNVAAYLPYCDGFIIGSEVKHDGLASHPVDPHRVVEFMRSLE